MVLTEYNEEEHIKHEKSLSHAEGRVKGRAEGRAEGQAETDAKRIVDAYKY